MNSKTFDLMAAMTIILLVATLGTAIYGVVRGLLAIGDFLAAFVPVASMALGYWFRGQRQDGGS